MIVLQRIDWIKGLADRYPVFGIMILSLAIKLFLSGFDQAINPDGVLYIAAARQMAEGNIAGALELYPMPAYPLLLSLVHYVISDWIVTARLIGISALVLVSVPLYGITRILFNRQAAFWATLCLALTPEANEQALSVLRDPVFLLLGLTAVLFLLKGMREQNTKRVFVALLLTGGAFLFRVEGIVFLVVPILFFIVTVTRTKDALLKQFARKVLSIWIGVPLAAGIIILLVFGPQLLGQNRVGELAAEGRRITEWKAFDNYRAIYSFFKTIETEPPFSGSSKSLPAIVRHWMPLIYLIGLLEYFVKQMFLPFLLPLLLAGHRYLAVGDRKNALVKQFVLLTWLVYMIFILYSFIVRDFIQGRFLFTPAVLLYPWVGYGFTLIWQWLKGIRFAHILQFAVVVMVIAAPCIKSVQAVIKSDRGALEAGAFISGDMQLASAKTLFSDTRLWLYANGTDSYQSVNEKSWTINGYVQQGKAVALEKLAMNNDAEILVLSINLKKTTTIPEFDHYEVYQQFPGRKGVTIIYRRTDS